MRDNRRTVLRVVTTAPGCESEHQQRDARPTSNSPGGRLLPYPRNNAPRHFRSIVTQRDTSFQYVQHDICLTRPAEIQWKQRLSVAICRGAGRESHHNSQASCVERARLLKDSRHLIHRKARERPNTMVVDEHDAFPFMNHGSDSCHRNSSSSQPCDRSSLEGGIQTNQKRSG